MPAVRLAELLGQPGVSAFLRGVVQRGRYGEQHADHERSRR